MKKIINCIFFNKTKRTTKNAFASTDISYTKLIRIDDKEIKPYATQNNNTIKLHRGYQ